MTSRTAARDALLRRASAITSALTVAALTATGGLLGAVAAPAAGTAPTPADANLTTATPATASPVPHPRRTVYVRVPVPAVKVPGRTAAKAATAPRPVVPVRRPAVAPKRAPAPPATTSSGS